MSRPLVQYDLDNPPAVYPEPSPTGPVSNAARGPPIKRRKRNHHNPRQPSQKVHVQHWDDPGSSSVGVVYDEDAAEEQGVCGEEAAEGANEEESRLLTHEEIWDDSALIDAWNSAQAEYEAYHGTSKTWKTEPVKKSPLWYNKPYTAPRSPDDTSFDQAQAGDDSAPIDFNTFVPTHDPSLAIPSVAENPSTAVTAPFFVPPVSMTTVSRDEAFKNALNAMYWTGYWTAVYQCRSQADDTKADGLTEADEEDEVEIDTDKDEEANDLTPSQR